MFIYFLRQMIYDCNILGDHLAELRNWYEGAMKGSCKKVRIRTFLLADHAQLNERLKSMERDWLHWGKVEFCLKFALKATKASTRTSYTSKQPCMVSSAKGQFLGRRSTQTSEEIKVDSAYKFRRKTLPSVSTYVSRTKEGSVKLVCPSQPCTFGGVHVLLIRASAPAVRRKVIQQPVDGREFRPVSPRHA